MQNKITISRNNSYVVVSSIFFVGLLFKLMHWPGAGSVLIGSMTLIILALFFELVFQLKSKLEIQKATTYLFYILFVFGFIFKLMHWYGANNLLIISFAGVSVMFLKTAYSATVKIDKIVAASFSCVLIFSLFKIMHWPHSSSLLNWSFVIFSILVPIRSISIAVKIKDSSQKLFQLFASVFVISLIYCLMEIYLVIFGDGLATGDSTFRLIIVLLLFSLIIVLARTFKLMKTIYSNSEEFDFIKNISLCYSILFFIQALISVN